MARETRKSRGLCRKCPSQRDRTSPFCPEHRRCHNAYNVARVRRAFLRADLADEAWDLAPSWAPQVTHCLPPEGA